MISKSQGNNFLILVLAIAGILISSPMIKAQQEIPDKVKNIMLRGINAIDSARAPGDIDKALALFKEAASITPDFPDVHYYIGKTLVMLQGNTRNAIKELKKYLSLFPDAPDKSSVISEIDKLEQSLKSKRNSSLLGVDIVSLQDGIYIQRVFEMSLQRGDWRTQKLRVGDKILKINGVDLAGLTLVEALNKIDAESSEKVSLTLVRSGQPFDVRVPKKVNTRKLRQLDEDDLGAIVNDPEMTIIVLWLADNCGDCARYYSCLSDVLNKYEEKIRAVEINLDQNKMIGDEYGISKKSVPVISIYRKGKLLEKIDGFNQELFEEKIEAIMD